MLEASETVLGLSLRHLGEINWEVLDIMRSICEATWSFPNKFECTFLENDIQGPAQVLSLGAPSI